MLREQSGPRLEAPFRRRAHNREKSARGVPWASVGNIAVVAATEFEVENQLSP